MYDKRTLTKGMAASFGVVFLVILLVVSSGLAVSAPLAGVGGFTIKADQIRGDDLIQYVGTTDASDRANMPTGTAEFTHIEIDGLQLMKEVEMPAIGGNARVVITSTDTVTADSLLIKESYIHAENSTFNGLLIDEQTSNDPSEEFQEIVPSSEAQRHRGMDRFTDPKSINLSTQENPG